MWRILLALACLSSAARLRRLPVSADAAQSGHFTERYSALKSSTVGHATPLDPSRALATLLQASGSQASFNPSSFGSPHPMLNSSGQRTVLFSHRLRQPASVLMSDEKRMDNDGGIYTQKDFEQFYGDTWQQYWDAAKPVETGTTVAVADPPDGPLSPEDRQELLTQFQALIDSRKSKRDSNSAQDDAATEASSTAATRLAAPAPAQAAPSAASSDAVESISTVKFARPHQFTVSADFKVSLGGKLAVGDVVDCRLANMEAEPTEVQVICKDSEGNRIQFEVEPVAGTSAASAVPPAAASPVVAAIPLTVGAADASFGVVEKRMDSDGSTYTQRDFQDFYGSNWQHRWDSASPVVAPAPVEADPELSAPASSIVIPSPSASLGAIEKRIDRDGSSYTPQEFEAFYGDAWQQYWDAAKPADTATAPEAAIASQTVTIAETAVEAATVAETSTVAAGSPAEKRCGGPLSPEDRKELLEQFEALMEETKPKEDSKAVQVMAAPPPVAPAPDPQPVAAPAPLFSAPSEPVESGSTVVSAKQESKAGEERVATETKSTVAPRVVAKVTVY